ncbi:MAG: adenylyltransferase/cytidyltransferase family protein [Patescibacteria group bacterium]
MSSQNCATMQNLSKIFFDLEKITNTVLKHRQKGQRIVLTQGSFDLLHIGHARYCREAKSYGDVLVVAVDSDEKVRQRKGKDRPIVPQEERLEMLTHLAYVDYVFLKDSVLAKWALIKAIKPDTLIATAQTYGKDQIKDLKKHCQQIVVLEPMAVTSTSAKLRRMQIGTAKKIQKDLSSKLIKTIEEVLEQLKN